MPEDQPVVAESIGDSVTHAITKTTRRSIFDYLMVTNVKWWGRPGEIRFLSRLWKLEELPSTDSRFPDASGDIVQHRLRNLDWEDDWIFGDTRFQLIDGSDDLLLNFLCSIVHPAVVSEPRDVTSLVQFFNQQLAFDGWSLAATQQISGRPVFEGRRITGPRDLSAALVLPEYTRLRDPEVLQEHLRRISAGLEADPAAAIGSSKELVESVCKVILDDYSEAYTRNDNLPDLYKKTATMLRLNVEAVRESTRGSEAARRTLGALVTIVHSLAELRNELGLGHGRAKSSAASTRHAWLAFNAASAIAQFLLETWHIRETELVRESQNVIGSENAVSDS
jgi:AbiJ N-terminal domain 3/Abortive infection C-terminus